MMQTGAHVSILNRRTFLGLGIFFAVAGLLYGLALNLSSGWEAGELVYRMSLDYLLKYLISLPILWVAFVATRALALKWRIAIVTGLALPYTFVWQASYYWFCDFFELGHLEGAGSWWDIYIPLLVYAWQFAALFALEYHANAVAASARASALAEEAVRSELTALRAQINPHFLYNTYNAINASLPPELEATRELLAQLAGMFRYQVSVSREDLVPLQGELDFIRDYLALEQVRMGERLRYSIEVDETLAELRFPPLLLQPLIENAIKHGLSPKLEGGTVTLHISATEAPESLVNVKVCDDGIGLEASRAQPIRQGTGVGLATTRKRLELQFGAVLHLKQREAGGTLAHFALPLDALQVKSQSASMEDARLQSSDRAEQAQLSPARG